MEGAHRLISWLFVAAVTAIVIAPARADDQFLASISKLVTREARKQTLDKKFKFSGGPLEGTVQAVEPEKFLAIELKDFTLSNDLVQASLTAAGRFRVDGKVDHEAEVSALVDVNATVAAEAKFTKEDDKFFIEPLIKGIEIKLNIVEVLPANLKGGEELLSALAVAAFEKNKAKIIADVNKRLGKRPL